MSTEEMENLDSETQDNGGDDVTTDEVEDTSSETGDDYEDTEYEDNSDEELEKARKIAEDQRRRAEKAEQKLKELKKSESNQKGKKPKKESNDTLSKEEAILYAKGLSEEEVEKVKSIAKIEGESPLVSAESDYFKLWKEKEEKKREEQETQLDTSRGSAKAKFQKDFSSPQLSSEEHKALWKKKMGL